MSGVSSSSSSAGASSVVSRGAGPAAAAKVASPSELVASATVCDPMKQGDGIKAYATYKIKCTRTGRHAAPTEVFRRYSDFCWLHDALQYGFPGVIIPPLPEKKLTGTFETEFLQNRARFLQKFVDRCLDHPELRQARVLVRFLTTTDPDEFAEVKGAEKVSQGLLIKWLAQTGARAYKSVAGLAGFSSTSLPATSDDEVFEDIQRYVAMIEPHIQNTAKFAESIMTDRKEMATCHFDLGLAFTALGQAESGSISSDLNAFGHTVDQLSQLGQEHAQDERHVFVEPMKDMARQLAELKNALKRRAEAYHILLSAHDDFSKSGKYLQKLAVSGSGKATKVDAARAEHKRHEKLVEESRSHLAIIDARLQKEIARFQKHKLDDFTESMLQYATSQAQYYQKEEGLWGGVADQLDNSGSPKQSGGGRDGRP